jgi:hypothetical protein
MPKQLYCYVDESGHDTRGRLFVVSVVITGSERDRLRDLCERIEQTSLKGVWKWTRVSRERQMAYARQIVAEPELRGKLFYAVYKSAKGYLSLTVNSVALALNVSGEEDYQVTLVVDGLPRAHVHSVGRQLRGKDIRTRKVRGARDESDALIRLADGVCGLVRAAEEGQPEMRRLLERGVQAGVLKDVSLK